jgi:arginyl-tRNA synthetase
VRTPRDATHGDLATNAAMVLAKPAGTNPRALASLLVEELGRHDRVVSAEIAGPGFINLRLAPQAWLDELALIAARGADYGRSTLGGARPSTSNMSRPIRPGRCTWAIAAARWWAMRWPPCSNLPGTR